MANEFSKEETVAFEEECLGFEDQLAISEHVSIYRPDSTTMERSGDVIWRPQPYVAQSFDGMDQTANFKDKTQLSVPTTLGYEKSSNWIMDAKQLRDALQEGRLYTAAREKIASDINVAVLEHASMFGSLFVKRAAAAAGFDDVAQCEAIMNEQGIPGYERCLALSSRDYLGMANNLAVRGTVAGKVEKAYETGYVGRVASFDTYKLDYARRLALAAGGGAITITTLAAGGNVYVPRATGTAATGERSNVDNRFQNVLVSATANVKAGDAFTIATVEAVHHITKQGTGQLKTFRVVSITDATHMVITPPLITAQGGTDPELQYQNCIVGTPAANSAIVWLNTATAATNPFWQRESIELVPGHYVVPDGAGVAVMRATTKQGIELVMQKWYDGMKMKIFYRVDALFGVVNKNPEMNGIMMFSQP